MRTLVIRSFAVFFLIILCGVCIFLLYNHFYAKAPQRVSTYKICNKNIIGESANLLATGKYQALQPIVDNIKNQNNYTSDANCLYVLVSYYARTGDIDSAQHYLDMIRNSFGQSVKFSTLFTNTSQGPSLSALEGMVNNQQKINNMYKNNMKALY